MSVSSNRIWRAWSGNSMKKSWKQSRKSVGIHSRHTNSQPRWPVEGVSWIRHPEALLLREVLLEGTEEGWVLHHHRHRHRHHHHLLLHHPSPQRNSRAVDRSMDPRGIPPHPAVDLWLCTQRFRKNHQMQLMMKPNMMELMMMKMIMIHNPRISVSIIPLPAQE